ncbi:putative acetyltransferase [Naumannella halotolerans]|uniref:Putative acetyltransferase n=2 Tax=Naumannella halotolerans TaxID=993414 RepID=A0A4R7J8Q6_9ACTN|nr:putative acetyltransferase [Naumannella halotolerans]
MKTFRAQSADPAENPDVVRWWRAVNQGFHGERLSDDRLARMVEGSYDDDLLLRGVYDREIPEPGNPNRPVATFCSADGSLNVGGRTLLPARLITDVTVRPTHRRRGLLRTMMSAELAEARDAGLPVAALTVTEGSIYRRFGFGPATFETGVTVQTNMRFGLQVPPAGGNVVLVDAARVQEYAADIFAVFHQRVPGSVSRFSTVPTHVSGVWDFGLGKENRRTRGAIHLSADRRPDGYVTWEADRQADQFGKITITDLVATTAQGYLELWDFLGHIDLIEEVHWRQAPVEDPLRFALNDPNLYQVTDYRANVWLRLLDVAAVLQARPWVGRGTVVIDVSDSLDLVPGRYLVEVADGSARVTRTDQPADVALDAAALASISLGAVRPSTLQKAGLINELRSGGTDNLDQLVAAPAPVWGITHF